MLAAIGAVTRPDEDGDGDGDGDDESYDPADGDGRRRFAPGTQEFES